MPLPSWAVQKLGPLPVWGWGALSLTGGVGYVLYKRRQAKGGAATLGANTPAGGSQYPTDTGSGAGGSAGGFGSGLPGDPTSTYGGGLGGGSLFTQPQDQTPLQPASQPAQAAPLQPAPAAAAAAPSVQIAPSLLGGGYTASQFQIQNPVGSADRDALASINPLSGQQMYHPSLSDYASEQPGGISVVQAGLPGTQPSQGQTYTIYGTNTGSGPVVPAAQRIAGERYDSSGRVIV